MILYPLHFTKHIILSSEKGVTNQNKFTVSDSYKNHDSSLSFKNVNSTYKKGLLKHHNHNVPKNCYVLGNASDEY